MTEHQAGGDERQTAGKMKPDFMRIVRGRDELRQAAQSWRNSYKRPHNGVTGWGADYDEIVAALDAFDFDTGTAADLNAALRLRHHGSWGELTCDGCDAVCGAGHQHEDIVRLGAEPDYEERWLDLCPDCIDAIAKGCDCLTGGGKR